MKILPMVVLTLSVMLPPEVRVEVAGQALYSYRLAWVAILPWLLLQMATGRFRWQWNDLLMIAGSSWIAASLVAVYGIAQGLPSGLGLALDLILPYLIARSCISDPNDFRRILVVLAPVFLIVGLVLPFEAYLQERFVRDTARAMFGGLGASEYGMGSAFVVQDDTRFGLLRAMGPFSHPILAGIFFASLLPLYYWSGLRGWPKYAGLVAGLMAVFTLSSAAYLALIMFIVFAGFDFVRRIISVLTWQLFTAVCVVLALVLQLVSNNGLVSILIRFTLTPQTGYYRLLIWEYGIASVKRHPMFGIAFQQFQRLGWMGDSIDAHWLNLAVRHGLPAAVLLLALMVSVILGCSRKASRAAEPDASAFLGFAITLVTLVIVAFSVAYFGGMLIWFVMVVGMAASMAGLGQHARPVPRPIRQVHQHAR